ncbi:placenta-specific gene 8 protein-like [Styela clava]
MTDGQGIPMQQTGYTPVPVVAVQPAPTMETTTTVVVTQPTEIEWSSGICYCFDDIKSCCCSLWLGNCFYACLAKRMGDNCCVGCSGYPAGCVPGGHLAMRSAFRNKHGIQGTICDDCCISTFCLPCGMCQLSREMDRYGYPETNSCC